MKKLLVCALSTSLMLVASSQVLAVVPTPAPRNVGRVSDNHVSVSAGSGSNTQMTSRGALTLYTGHAFASGFQNISINSPVRTSLPVSSFGSIHRVNVDVSANSGGNLQEIIQTRPARPLRGQIFASTGMSEAIGEQWLAVNVTQ